MRFLTNTKNKRQGTTSIVISCLYSFLLTVPSSPFSEPLINKKRTRTLSRKELGSSTNCMVDGTGLEPVTSCTSSRCSTSWANRPYSVLPKSACLCYHTFCKKASLFCEKYKTFLKLRSQKSLFGAGTQISAQRIGGFLLLTLFCCDIIIKL